MIDLENEISYIEFPDTWSMTSFYKFAELVFTSDSRAASASAPCQIEFDNLYIFHDWFKRSLYQIHLLLKENELGSMNLLLDAPTFEEDIVSKIIDLVNDFILDKNQVMFGDNRIKVWPRNSLGALNPNLQFTDHVFLTRSPNDSIWPVPRSSRFYVFEVKTY